MNSSTIFRFGSPQAAPGATHGPQEAPKAIQGDPRPFLLRVADVFRLQGAPGASPGDLRPLPLPNPNAKSAILPHVSFPTKRSARRGFSLTELLVAIAIIGVLMSLSAVAVNAARNSQKVNQTRLTITKLDRIISEQIRRYDSRYISNARLTAAPAGTSNQQRAWYIRRNLINGDMPDRWADVEFVASSYISNPPPTIAQQNYKKLWDSPPGITADPANPDRDSAECLFMIIMLGGFADCLDCGPMQSFEIGDTDSDGLPEFLDAWGNPIGFLLWAPGLELPPGTTFFGTLQDGRLQNPWSGEPTPMLGMRPLIYSGGADGIAGFNRGTQALSSLSLPDSAGRQCGDPTLYPEIANRGKQTGLIDYRRDNITNFAEEARR